MADTEQRALTLEEKFSQLEEIISGMEKPDVLLEDAFSLYEKGMKLVRECNEQLDLVEKKMLVIAKDGQDSYLDE